MFENALAAGIHKNVNDILMERDNFNGKIVVDLACGDGRTTYVLRSLGAEVRPYDIFPEYSKLDDTPKYADLNEQLPIESESVDFVILQEVMEHLPDQLFALQEISRILKPGGELFLTTPNRSSLVSKFAYLCFESENLRGTPPSAEEGVWGQNETGTRKYYGHLFLIGVQQLRTLAMVAGFRSFRLMKSDRSTSSVALAIPFYVVVLAVSLKAYLRARRKEDDATYRREKWAQFVLNISPRALTNKYLIASLVK
ncbi:class I SAM-dependent methyltransferase [Paraburkholderia sediminicola]|uniref:class I SAM-dependent methyltransferase n=1 Tax=Paraburkholderia sediminicola TaxID=458836 RepID=UPI0038BC68BC